MKILSAVMLLALVAVIGGVANATFKYQHLADVQAAQKAAEPVNAHGYAALAEVMAAERNLPHSTEPAYMTDPTMDATSRRIMRDACGQLMFSKAHGRDVYVPASCYPQ